MSLARRRRGAVMDRGQEGRQQETSGLGQRPWWTTRHTAGMPPSSPPAPSVVDGDGQVWDAEVVAGGVAVAGWSTRSSWTCSRLTSRSSSCRRRTTARPTASRPTAKTPAAPALTAAAPTAAAPTEPLPTAPLAVAGGGGVWREDGERVVEWSCHGPPSLGNRQVPALPTGLVVDNLGQAARRPVLVGNDRQARVGASAVGHGQGGHLPTWERDPPPGLGVAASSRWLSARPRRSWLDAA
jgi:hypothetical protein